MPWSSLPILPPDGRNWPLSVAAQILDVSEQDLRRQINKEKLEPAGVIKLASFRRSGRHPMAYPAEALMAIADALRSSQANRGEK